MSNTTFVIIPRKESKSSLVAVSHLSWSAKDLQGYEIFLLVSNKCCIPSSVTTYRPLGVTFFLPILRALSPPLFVQLCYYYSQDPLSFHRCILKVPYIFCILLLILVLKFSQGLSNILCPSALWILFHFTNQ